MKLKTLSHCAGINLAFARALLSKHCNVLFADRALRPEAQELVSQHSKPSPSQTKAVFQQTDVRDWQQLDRMFHTATAAFGTIDVVCPGAGVYEPVGILAPNVRDQSPFLSYFSHHRASGILPVNLHPKTIPHLDAMPASTSI